jgi:hypothetical protein
MQVFLSEDETVTMNWLTETVAMLAKGGRKLDA